MDIKPIKTKADYEAVHPTEGAHAGSSQRIPRATACPMPGQANGGRGVSIADFQTGIALE